MSAASPDPFDLADPWLGDAMYDFQLSPGDDVVVDADDPDAVAAARRFRDVLGRFASGITIVTAVSGGAPVGLTCQSFTSVSLNPPLVLFVPARTSRSWPAIHRAGNFCVNFLAADQTAASDQMASGAVDKFAGLDWTPAPATGSPLLAGALGYVDCRIRAVHPTGDHDVVIGRVLDLGVADAGSGAGSGAGTEQPLVYFRGGYTTTQE